jgi:hypothetical protein
MSSRGASFPCFMGKINKHICPTVKRKMSKFAQKMPKIKAWISGQG